MKWNDLENMLLNEQKKKYDNHLVIGGLEKYVQNWAAVQKSEEDPNVCRRVDDIVGMLNGYSAADQRGRQEMIERVLPILRDGPPAIEQAATEEQGAKEEEPVEEKEDEHPPSKMRLRGEAAYHLDASVTRLQGVGPSFAKKLQRIGVSTVKDLLYLFPRRYDDYSQLKTVSQLMYGEEVTVLLTVCEVKNRTTYNGLNVTNVILADPTGTIQATYFNQPFLQKQFKAGQRIFVSGRIDQDLGRPAFKQPEWEPFSEELVHTGRIVPVYPLTEGLTNRWLRRLMHSVVEFWAPRLNDPLPPSIRERERLVSLSQALKEVHFPTTLDKMREARHRLAFEEFLYIQIGVFRQRSKWHDLPGRALPVDAAVISDFVASLPFQLTNAQKRAMDEIIQDIQKSAPMSRLLQGDVGSGKTVVAAGAMLAAVANHAQVAVLTPTEILAEQHFKTLSALFSRLPFPPRLGLLTGSLKNKEKEEIRTLVAQGQVDIAVGTHALIQESVEFKDLGLAVIDEQHRFGVEQRGTIRSKGVNPHILVMSATPIPRTLALTVYGDLDLSMIDEMPPGRQEIKTKWMEPRERERAYRFIRGRVEKGEQAFVICPLIEESEAIDAKAAVEEYERLSKVIFPDLRIGLIHGKLRPAEKEASMLAFRNHEVDILVATSVVEVGIDVPNATVMLIEGADRFGLAQLHQFRGRVGRGDRQSYCLLLAEKSGATSDERLKVIESSQDGFRLAEEDLKLRGPGEFFGTRQSGLPDLRIAKLSDLKLLEQARAAAQQLFETDRDLSLPENQSLAQQVNEFWMNKGDLS